MIADVVSVPHKLYLDSLTRLVVMPVAIRCQKKNQQNCERTPSVTPTPVELPLGGSFLAWEPADVEGAAAAPRFDDDGQEC